MNNNDIKIEITVRYMSGENAEDEHEIHRETLGSLLSIPSAFESAGEDLGKLENQLNRLVVKGDNQHKDED